MTRNLFPLVVLCCVGVLFTEQTVSQTCPDPAPQTSGSHSFHREGETIDIPILVGDCQPLALEVRWFNGRNNGCHLRVIFLDTNGQPIYAKKLSAFQTGHFEFPFTTVKSLPWLGTRSMYSIPSSVTIEAVRPYGFPATIFYTVSRAGGPARQKHPELDNKIATTLQIAAGKLLSAGQSKVQGSEERESITYKLEEVQLPEPRTLEINGQKETLGTAFRLILTGGDRLARAGLIWIDDAALPVFRRRDFTGHIQEIGALIYDRSILKRNAEISVSEDNGSSMYTLWEPLMLPPDFVPPISPNGNEDKRTGQTDAVVAIRGTARTIGATRYLLVQIELKTNRPFPAKDAALHLQIGKRFFLNELSGDHSGRRLTLTLTPEMFAGLRQGAEIIAFFDKPDRSGFSDQNIWRFGKLNKEMLEESK